MERFIIQYFIGDKGWAAQVAEPVVYESRESLLRDFNQAVEAYRTKNQDEFSFFVNEVEIDLDWFVAGDEDRTVLQELKVLTVDEWFENQNPAHIGKSYYG